MTPNAITLRLFVCMVVSSIKSNCMYTPPFVRRKKNRKEQSIITDWLVEKYRYRHRHFIYVVNMPSHTAS